MALDFPNSPTNGQVFSGGGRTWVYDSTATAWKSGPAGAASITNTMLADVPTDTVKGRTTAGTGVPTDLTMVELETMIGIFDTADYGLVPPSDSLGYTIFDNGSWGPAYPATGVPDTAIGNGITCINTAEQSQVVVSATAYYITNSALIIPASTLRGMQIGTIMVWDVYMTKTAAGTGTFQIRIYRGTNGTTADTADVTQTIGTQTAAVDSMYVRVTIRVNTTGATGGYFWTITPINKAVTATGFGVATGTTGYFSGTVASVAMNTSNLRFGLGFIATTGTPTIRVVSVVGQMHKLC